MNFILNTPFDEDMIYMDCHDGCDQIARLAERVVAGESIEAIRPELTEHMAHWRDCREEFEALVVVLKAEHSGDIEAFLSELEELRRTIPSAPCNCGDNCTCGQGKAEAQPPASDADESA